MCGRFVRKRSLINPRDRVPSQPNIDDLQPSFNVAPTHNVAVVVDDGERHLVSMRWGLVPGGQLSLNAAFDVRVSGDPAMEHEDFWLDISIEDHRRVLDLLGPYPATGMEAFAVSNLVNFGEE